MYLTFNLNTGINNTRPPPCIFHPFLYVSLAHTFISTLTAILRYISLDLIHSYHRSRSTDRVLFLVHSITEPIVSNVYWHHSKYSEKQVDLNKERFILLISNSSLIESAWL
jgi:hypothetical protein